MYGQKHLFLEFQYINIISLVKVLVYACSFHFLLLFVRSFSISRLRILLFPVLLETDNTVLLQACSVTLYSLCWTGYQQWNRPCRCRDRRCRDSNFYKTTLLHSWRISTKNKKPALWEDASWTECGRLFAIKDCHKARAPAWSHGARHRVPERKHCQPRELAGSRVQAQEPR